MEKIAQAVFKAFARFYNSLHPKLKIAIMVAISFFAAGFTKLLIGDLTDLNNGDLNKYVKLIFDSLIPLLTVLYNILQQTYVESGTKLLAYEGDKKTIQKLDEKISKAEDLKAGL